jgi:hypothetical protein
VGQGRGQKAGAAELRHCATAHKRIGVSYRCHELIDLNEWCTSTFEQITSN